MLRRGYLASTSVYLSNAHDEVIIDRYLEAVDDCFLVLANAIESNSVEALLETRLRSDSFTRVTL